MKSDLPDAPILKSMPSMIDAAQYNLVRLALARMGSPQQVVLGMRGLSIELDRGIWICSDRRLNDIPLIAWTDFDDAGRGGLHVPVRCRVCYYHAYARVIGATVLAEVERRLKELLDESQRSPSSAHQVISFRRTI